MLRQTRAHENGAPRDGDALDACERVIQTYRRHAERNRTLSVATTVGIVLSSAMVPVCIVISTETGAFVFGKLLPSLLAAGAALAAAVAHVVRPYERWRMFRNWLEVLAAERLSYKHRIGEYSTGDPDRLLVERVIAARRGFADEWQTLIPTETTEAIAAARDPNKAS